jgi:hypothetical protein
LEFFRLPIDPKLHPSISNDFSHKPDLEVELSSGLGVSGMSGNHVIEYNLKDKSFELRGEDISSDSKYC